MENCALGDRLACDALEFEGPPPTTHVAGGGGEGSDGGVWQPSRAELALAWALLPLLLVGIASKLWRRRVGRIGQPAEGGGRGGGVPAGVLSRRLEAVTPLNPTLSGTDNDTALERAYEHSSQDQQQPPLPPLPPHPAADANAARSSGGAGTTSASSPAAAAAASMLAAADNAISGLLVLPLSILQHAKHLAQGGRGAAAAEAAGGPNTPAAGAGLGATPAANQAAGGGAVAARRGSGGHYGLGIGEAETEEEEEDEEGGEESELTKSSLRRLQESAEFRAYLKARGLTTADVGNSARRLRLYRRLRRLDPQAFWQLLSPSSRTVFLSRAPSRLLLATDYVLSTAASLAAAAAAYWFCVTLTALPAGVRLALAAVPLWAAAAQLLQSRPVAGGLYGLWYEEPRWGHAAPAWRCVAAALLELAYLAGSAGAGAAVSLGLRCLSGRQQAVGELLAGVHAVQEVRLLSERPSEEPEPERVRWVVGGKPVAARK